jgi:hypothetical protein
MKNALLVEMVYQLQSSAVGKYHIQSETSFGVVQKGRPQEGREEVHAFADKCGQGGGGDELCGRPHYGVIMY